MSLHNVFAEYEKIYKERVQADTWGHLFPKVGYYTGKLRLVRSAWDELSVVDCVVEGVSDSPWKQGAISDVMTTLWDEIPIGSVADFDIAITVAEEDRVQDEIFLSMRVSNLRKTVVLAPLKG